LLDPALCGGGNMPRLLAAGSAAATFDCNILINQWKRFFTIDPETSGSLMHHYTDKGCIAFDRI
jgi:hypothetical protein